MEGAGLGTGSIRQIHAIIRRSFSQGVRWGWRESNPAVLATTPAAGKAKIEPPSPDRLARILKTAVDRDPEFAALVYLAAATGARRGELCGLRWADVDFEQSEILIERAVIVVKRVVIEMDIKSHSKRRIGVGPRLLAVLAAHRQAMEQRAAAGGMTLHTDAHIFSDDLDGTGPWKPDRVTHAWTRLRALEGADGVRLHDLRHFVATQMMAAGVDARTGASRLGQANPNTFLNVYSHWLPAPDRAAAALLDDILDG